MGENLVIPLFAAAGVFFLWLVELFLPFPWVVEELFKFLLVGYLVRVSGSRSKLSLVMLTGFAFSISESLFYLFNYLPEGSLLPFLIRLAVTVPMHLLTFVLLYLGLRKGTAFGLAALALSMGLHYWFNSAAAGLNLR